MLRPVKRKQTGFASYGYGIGTDWESCVERCLASLDHVRGGANVGFLYVSDVFSDSLNAIRARVLEFTGVEVLTGTASVGVCCTGQEFMGERAMVLLLMNVEADAFQEVLPARGGSWHFPSLRPRASLGILHADPSQVDALASALFSECFMVGGLSASEGVSAQITTNAIRRAGAGAVVFGPEVDVRVGMTQGTAPLGPVRRVTRSVGNVLLRLDDRPALEVLLEDAQQLATDGQLGIAGHIFSAIHLPNRDRSDWLVRDLLGANPLEDAVAIAHEPRLGDRIQFVKRDPQSARADLIRMLRELAREGRKPGAGLYFSCVGRGEHLFGEPSVELELIAEELGDFPLVGFFGAGELFRRDVYGHTGVLVLFWEPESDSGVSDSGVSDSGESVAQ